jgi:hypothetical protein
MAIFNSLNWFRLQILPYLTVIKNNSNGLPAPIIYNYSPQLITAYPLLTPTLINITGDFFHPLTTITCPTCTITNSTFINSTSLSFEMGSSINLIHNITITTPSGSTVITVESILEQWIDLRSGTTSVFTVLSEPSTNITYNSEGIRSNGSLWWNWYKFNSHQWLRSTPKNISIIMKTRGAHMCGILSEEQDENSNSQWLESEIMIYLNSGESLSRFYGTDSTHNGVNGNILNISIDDNVYPYYKWTINNNGNVGEQYSIHGLADLTNFDDNSNLINSGVIDNVFTANGNTLMVGALPRGNTRMVAFKIEDV